MAFKTGKNQKHKINDKFGIATFSEKLFVMVLLIALMTGLLIKHQEV